MALFTLLSAAAANAAIAVDATSSGSGPGDITVQHTTSGANRLMLVGISAGAGGSSAAISSVKYNNVALTLVGSASTSDNYTKMWMYRLVAPDTGTYDLVVDYSSNPGQGSVVGVMTFTGVDQTTPLGTFQGAANHNTGPATVNVSSATGELVFDTVATCWNALNAVGSGQTQRWKAAPASTEGGGSTEAGDSTVTMSWTLKNSQSWAIGAVPIKPAATTDVDLANHAAGQEADKFTTASSVTGAELFAFKLTNNTAGSKTVDQIVFPLSSVTGIAQGDFANLAIYVDANNDGTIGAGETTSVGGSGVVNAGVSTITFTTDFTIGASSTVNYILKGDVSSLVGTDTVTIGLGTSNITLTSGTVGGSAATNVTHTADNVDLTQIHVRWRNDDGGEGGFNTGTGADGAISLSSNLNLNTQARAGGRSYPDGVAYRVGAISGTSIMLRNAAGTTLSNTNGIAAGDEILIINLQGSSSDNGSVGNYEFLKVQSVSGGVLTVASAPGNDYDGSGNSFTTQKVFVQRVPQYTNVTTNAYSITSGAWDGGTDHDDSSCTDNQYTGIVAFRATGTVTVSASGSISANALGYRGGAGGGNDPNRGYQRRVFRRQRGLGRPL